MATYRIAVLPGDGIGQEVIEDASWSGLRGQWLEVRVQTTYTENGTFALAVNDADGSNVLAVEQTLNMWRAGTTFVRPKWGIYRSLLDRDDLRAEEETVRFANFAITNGAEPSTDCRQ